MLPVTVVIPCGRRLAEQDREHIDESNTMRLKPRDLYRLRLAQLQVKRTTLRVHLAQQELERLALELERRYELLAKDAILNVQTGVITLAEGGGSNGAVANNGTEVNHGPADDARQGAP